MDFFSKLFRQMGLFFSGLSGARKFTFVLVILMVAGGLIYLVTWGSHVDYRVLYADLSQSDASAIVDRLQQQKIPYLLAEGNTIMVPSDKLYQCRLDLSSQGLPQGGSVGFELFDENKLGMSEYVQKLNYQRALQGELARTISQFEEVKYARVHIVMPKKALFADEKNPPSASVVLHLNKGSRLNSTQVDSIVNLVSRSVEGLKAQNITVVDTSGEMLYAGGGGTESQQASAAHAGMKNALEQSLQHKIKTLLEQVVGREKAIVRVSAEIEMKDYKQTREVYDPNAAVVRSEQRNTEESLSSNPSASGVPGVEPNVIGESSTTTAAPTNSFKKVNETINYEITRVVEDTIEPVREIKRLSVAVLVDGSYKKAKGKKGNETLEYVPRSEDEIAKFRAIVEKAMGFNNDRGDQLEVVNMPFEQMKITQADRELIDKGESRKFWAPYIKYGVMMVMAMLIFFFFVRPILRQVMTTAPEVSGMRVMQEAVPQIEDQTGVPRIESGESSQDAHIMELAQSNPDQFAQRLRLWMNQENNR